MTQDLFNMTVQCLRGWVRYFEIRLESKDLPDLLNEILMYAKVNISNEEKLKIINEFKLRYPNECKKANGGRL